MSHLSQKYIKKTKNIKNPNSYIQALYNKFKDWAFDEVAACSLKGQWRQKFFTRKQAALHIEIGPGNGKHFSNLCFKHPESCYIAMELKYKPLIQTISRVRKNNSTNGAVIRIDASLITNVFEEKELNNVYIHFPDPWLKKSNTKKHQLIQKDFCKTLYKLQRPQSFLEFKTDSSKYFSQSVVRFQEAGYKLIEQNFDLYKDQSIQDVQIDNLSQFELLFFKKQIHIKRALLQI